MIQGENLWHSGITKNMQYQKINDKNYFTFNDMPKNPYMTLVNATRKNPNQIIFVDNDQRKYTYFEFTHMVNQYADYLKQEYHVKKGDHIGLLLYTTIDFCLNFYAISKLGAVCIPLPTKYRKSEVKALVDKSHLDLLVLEEKYDVWFRDDVFQKIIVKAQFKRHGLEYISLDHYHGDDMTTIGELEDEIIIMFTSGTTSISKGVVLTNYNVMHAIMIYQRILNIKEEDKTIIPVPIYHITGLVALMGLFVYSGATTYLHARYNAQKILDCIEREQITFMHGSPTVFLKLLDYKDQYPNLKSLRMLACGSSYTPLEKMHQFHKWLPYTQFKVIYGMTETASPALICPYDSPTSIYATAAGLPIPGVSVKIVNEQNEECEIGEIGTLLIKGTNVTTCYYNMVSDAIDEDDWLDTGDMAYFNDDNYVFVVDRKKDMINRGGEKIWCKDVEETICSHPYVNECAVVGISSDEYGEVAAAVVVLKDSCILTEIELQEYLSKELAHFKIPEKILFMNEIYKTDGLKVDKKRIRQLFK